MLPNISFGGIPTEEEVICPVGGEKFTVIGTMSCSTMGRTMSFRPLTSCDFVTRLPVCPSNGFPMYQEFSGEQITSLEKFTKTDEFEVLRQLPPWQRAYGIALNLGQSGTETAFNLLLSALWYESGEFLESEEAVSQLMKEAEDILLRADAETRPFLNAILGYMLSAVGRFDEANIMLNNAASAQSAPDYLLQYISAIQACQSDMAQEGCRPNDSFNP